MLTRDICQNVFNARGEGCHHAPSTRNDAEENEGMILEDAVAYTLKMAETVTTEANKSEERESRALIARPAAGNCPGKVKPSTFLHRQVGVVLRRAAVKSQSQREQVVPSLG